MQWGHIKTLFILSFLILNIYLVSAFIDRQQDIGYLDNQELPIEDQLAAENITYNIDTDVTESTYITVKQRVLSVDELEELKGFEGQTSEVINESFIATKFNSPISIPKYVQKQEIESSVQTNVLYGEEYLLWNWNEELNVLVFFQKKDERTIYYNQNGLLLVYLNEDNEMTHYTQTVLGEAEVQGDPVALNQPIQVIGTLFKGNYLNRDDVVNDVKLGYYSRIAAEGIQVFAPTWRVTVNEERDHYVNAIEGIVYESDELEFLQNVIDKSVTRIMTLDEGNELRSSILPELNARLAIDNRSETE